MTGREWGWRPAQAEGIWRHGARWTKPLFAAVPWITLGLLLVMFGLLGDTVKEKTSGAVSSRPL